MSDDYETIDEDGDILIILTPSSEPFAPWRTTSKEEGKEDDEDTEIVEQEHVGAIDADKPMSGDRADFEDVTSPMPKEFRALVSSAILRRASAVFHKDLDPNGPWKQSDIQPDGFRHKCLDGFDADALRHVLNLIHLKNNRVPHVLAMDDLAKEAIVVDYLQCHEAITFAAKSWIDDDMELPEEQLSRSLVLWFLISTVFRIEPIFQQTAFIIIADSIGPCDTLGLPMGADVLRKLS